MPSPTEYQFNYNDYFDAANSSVIEEVYYNSRAREMVVGIVSDGYVRWYGYAGVTALDFSDFREASSAGAHYNRKVKGNFTTMNRDPDGPWIFVPEAVAVSGVKTPWPVHNAPAVSKPKKFVVSAEFTSSGPVEAATLEDAIAKVRANPLGYFTFEVTGVEGV